MCVSVDYSAKKTTATAAVNFRADIGHTSMVGKNGAACGVSSQPFVCSLQKVHVFFIL